MTTPQNNLYVLAERIRYLTDMFESDENDETIFDKTHQIELQLEDVLAMQKRHEELMNLIVKLLNK